MNGTLKDYARSMCAYAGMSMYPVLRDSDLLLIEPYSEQRIHVGDIILFPSGEKELLVHRVVEVSTRGVRTRGDYIREIDPDYVQPEAIRGKVVALWRNGKKRPVFGGWQGLIVALMMGGYTFAKRMVFSTLRYLLRGPYYHKVLLALGSRWLRPHIIVFQTPHPDQQVQMFLGTYRIGVYNTIRERWHIRSPFQFLIHPEHMSTSFQNALHHQHEESLCPHESFSPKQLID